MNDFEILPIELIVVILEHLDIPSLLAASATCREWRRLAQTPSLVYSTLCYRYGVQDGPPGHDWPTPKRIEALKRYQARWNSLRWLKGYTFCTDSGDLWEMFSSVYAQSSIGSSQITFRKVISASAHQREKQWAVSTDVNIRDFGMDLFQDLAVIVAKESQRHVPSAIITRGRMLHLRTMSNGDPHPAAKNPNLSYKLQYVQLENSCTIQVSNDHVGVLFWNETVRPLGLYPAHELVIWNWKTGVVLLHLFTNTENVVSGFCFLSKTCILVAWGVIVYPGVEDAHKKSSLDVYDISKPATSPEKRFLLPPMQPDAAVSSFSIFCDPTPTPNHTVPRPFYTSPDDKICVVAVNFLYQRGGVVLRESINFIFFTSTLLADYPSLDPIEEATIPKAVQTLDPASASTSDNSTSLPCEPILPQPIRVPWSQWGEKTRLTMWRMPTGCYTICVSGTRVVRRVQTAAPRRYKIQVCDFNPYAAEEKVQTETPMKPVSIQKYMHARQDNVFKNTLLFEDSLYGFLPYLEITTRSTFEMEEVMIDADNIYLVHGRSGFEREIEVLSF